MTRPSARALAVDLILKINAGRLSTQDLFHDRRLTQLETNDRALAYEMILGSLRWRLALDWLIERSSGRPLLNVSDPLIAILRLSIFQLRFLSRIPEYAAVSEGVELARSVSPKAAGFVNAVLRRYLRTKPALPSGEQVRDQAIRTSHPAWLLQRWRARYGIAKTEQIALKNNQPSSPAVRWNSIRGPVPECVRRQAGFRPCQTLQGCFYAESIPPDFKEGSDYVYQDEASQLAAFIPPADAGYARALDVCAAPGGKAFILAGRFPAVRALLADLSAARLISTRERAGKLGLTTFEYAVCDGAVALPFRRSFELVFVDAPCSGLGTLRRNPEIKWRVTEGSLKNQGRRQKEILDRSAAMVSPGGHLVYATCSTEPDENSDVVESFLKENRSFLLQPIHSPELQLFVDGGVYTTMNSYPDMDGFFGFLMQRKAGG